MNLKEKLKQFLHYYQTWAECYLNDDEMVNEYLKHFPDYNIHTEILEDGILSIRPSNNVEAFALRSWLKSFENNEGAKLMIRPYINGNPVICDGVKVIEKFIDNPIIKELEEVARAPFPNYPDTKIDRLSKNGGGLIPSDEDVFNVLFKHGKSCNSKEISSELSKIKEEEIKTVHITNALGRLVKSGRVFKNKNTNPITWTAKRPKTVNDVFYGTDLQRLEFVKYSGYKTMEEAIKELGSWNFEIRFKEWLKEHKSTV